VAEIDLVNRSAKSGYHEKIGEEKMDLPDVNDVVASLGRPYDVNDNVYTCAVLCYNKNNGFFIKKTVNKRNLFYIP